MKKTLAIVLALLMIVGLLPLSALAATTRLKEISNVAATTPSGDITPVNNAIASPIEFTVTTGSPAYFVTTGGVWQKAVDDGWQNMATDELFTGGEYRYCALLKLEHKVVVGSSVNTIYLFAQEGITVTIDGVAWLVPTDEIAKTNDFSTAKVYSPTYRVEGTKIISHVEATSENGDVAPLYGDGPKNINFTVTSGQPAGLTMGRWEKLEQAGWWGMDAEATFDVGNEYRYAVMVFLNTENNPDYYLAGKDDITVIIDGVEWTADGDFITSSTYCGIYVISPTYTVTDTKYTLRFNPGDGQGSMDPVTDLLGEYTLPECTFTAPEGMAFRGWSIEGEEKLPGDVVTITKDTSVTALWHDPTAPKIHIDKLTVSGITIPVAGQKQVTTGITLDNEHVAVEGVRWFYNDATVLLPYNAFEAGVTYKLVIDLDVEFGYEVTAETQIVHNFTGANAYYLNKKLKFEYTVPKSGGLIKNINLTGITPPVAGEFPKVDTIATDTAGLTIREVQWLTEEGTVMTSKPFEEKETYYLAVYFKLGDGYQISETATVTHDLEGGVLETLSLDYSYVKIAYTMPGGTPKTPIDSVKITHITKPVVGGTPDLEITLAGEVELVTEEFYWEKYNPETDEWEEVEEGTSFEVGTYCLNVFMLAKEGYRFNGDTKFYQDDRLLADWTSGEDSYYWHDNLTAQIWLVFTVEEKGADEPDVTLGDVNNDGKIDAKDALMVLKFAVNKIELTADQQLAAEVDGKEGIGAKDALEILKFAVNKITRFPIEK